MTGLFDREALEQRALAAALHELAQRVTVMERTNQISRGSIIDQTLDVYDTDENQTMAVGEQFDGSTAAVVLTGPPPPIPSKPIVTPSLRAVTVHWDGLWEPLYAEDGVTVIDNQVVAPMDFARVEVHASTDPDFTAEFANTIVETYESPRGGDRIVPIPTTGEDYTIKFVARTLSGKRSDASEGALVQADDVDGANIYRQDDPPWPDGEPGHEDRVGDLWFDTSPTDGIEVGISAKALTGNVATLTVDEGHGIEAGDSMSVSGVDATFDGIVTATATTASTVSYALVAADVPATAVVSTEAKVQGLGIGEPGNHPYIWDGVAWDDVQDQSISAALSLIDRTAVQVATNSEQIGLTQQQIDTLNNTAQDISGIAYAADGRINISDYEPRPEDMLDGAGQPKNEGSLWITRTRDRRNYCTNPSFETGTSPWSSANVTSITRTLMPPEPAGDGTYMLLVANDATANPHRVVYADIPIVPGQEWTASGYVGLESGAGTGITCSIEFRDASTAVVSTATGVAQTANVDLTELARPWVSGKAPDTATTMRVVFTNPNASDQWYLDAVLIELNPRLGRYFDGDSEGGSWTGAADASISELDGGAIIRFFSLEDGGWKEKYWTADTISSLDATVIDRGEMNGGFIADHTIPIDKQVTGAVVCSEVLAPGDLVNVWNNEGLFMVRKAKAMLGFAADGFVLDVGVIGDPIHVYTSGYNPLVTGLSPGGQFLSLTPGKTTASPPTITGTIVQTVGFAADANTLMFAAGTTVAIV